MPILGSQKPYKLHASSLTRSSWHGRDTKKREEEAGTMLSIFIGAQVMEEE